MPDEKPTTPSHIHQERHTVFALLHSVALLAFSIFTFIFLFLFLLLAAQSLVRNADNLTQSKATAKPSNLETHSSQLQHLTSSTLLLFNLCGNHAAAQNFLCVEEKRKAKQKRVEK
ncbi:unnamed protein product [Ceratitis capitata]|uniref:(Mediterranean fruit fly) hypothetical protein n=1 Tax=Ceratitis capitata TaxID=7213 RepID=A0A811V0T4_CERCA|nr:unnamed protein product [Ceratitis capitata]